MNHINQDIECLFTLRLTWLEAGTGEATYVICAQGMRKIKLKTIQKFEAVKIVSNLVMRDRGSLEQLLYFADCNVCFLQVVSMLSIWSIRSRSWGFMEGSQDVGDYFSD